MVLQNYAVSRSIVKLRAVVPENAFTAGILGSERVGNGIVISAEGLVLTIGYLITEATDVWLTVHEGREIVGHALAYDQVTGFGDKRSSLIPALEQATRAEQGWKHIRHQLDLIMQGRLQPVVDALVAHYQSEQLKGDDGATQAA